MSEEDFERGLIQHFLKFVSILNKVFEKKFGMRFQIEVKFDTNDMNLYVNLRRLKFTSLSDFSFFVNKRNENHYLFRSAVC